MIKSIILSKEKPISGESNKKVVAIYDYRDEPEAAFWVHLSNGDDLFLANDEGALLYTNKLKVLGTNISIILEKKFLRLKKGARSLQLQSLYSYTFAMANPMSF